MVALNHAVAVSRVRGPEEALALVEPLAGALANYFYYHAVRGHLLERLDRKGETRLAYTTSLGMAASAAEATLIRTYIERLEQDQ